MENFGIIFLRHFLPFVAVFALPQKGDPSFIESQHPLTFTKHTVNLLMQ